MKFRYTTKQGQFETNDYDEIPFRDLHSLNDKPAFENLVSGQKIWYFEGKFHRETGPAVIFSYRDYVFCLNGKNYENLNDWISNHPNMDIYLDAIGMNDLTERAIWKLQNL